MTTPDTSCIPIIFITGLVKKEDITEDRKIGGHYFPEKPFDSIKLFALLEKVLMRND